MKVIVKIKKVQVFDSEYRWKANKLQSAEKEGFAATLIIHTT